MAFVGAVGQHFITVTWAENVHETAAEQLAAENVHETAVELQNGYVVSDRLRRCGRPCSSRHALRDPGHTHQAPAGALAPAGPKDCPHQGARLCLWLHGLHADGTLLVLLLHGPPAFGATSARAIPLRRWRKPRGPSARRRAHLVGTDGMEVSPPTLLWMGSAGTGVAAPASLRRDDLRLAPQQAQAAPIVSVSSQALPARGTHEGDARRL